MESGSIQDLLRPLFCTLELNVRSHDDLGFFPEPQMRAESLLFDASRFVAQTGILKLSNEEYHALLLAIGSTVPGLSADDIGSSMSHLEPAAIDVDYASKLVDRGIIDRHFERAVRLVDFTRPVFSDDRCDLLEFAPEIPPSERNADSIRAGFIANLEGQGPAAEQLLEALEAVESGTPVDHQTTIDHFVNACNQRTDTVPVETLSGPLVSGFAADVIKLRSLRRKIAFHDQIVCDHLGTGDCLDDLDGSDAHPRSLMEFQNSLPADKIEATTAADPTNLMQVHPNARLSPTDCTLVSDFVPVDF
jgi:hypothetical protein